MSKPFRPMLAADISEDLEKLRYPVYVTPKLDGVRALVFPDGVYSRSMKKIPNLRVQREFSRAEFVGLDGELIVGEPTAPDAYRRTQSVTARIEDATPVRFYVFDMFDIPNTAYRTRAQEAADAIGLGCVQVESTRVHSTEELQALETRYLEQGYEGLILRSPEGLYKNGRSTVKEQGMLKLKRFVDGEAEIIGIEEEMHNGNTATTNELGRTARSSHAAGLVGKGRMGALLVRDVVTGVEFKIGTGFTADDRVKFWKRFADGPGDFQHVVKYKHFAIGAKDKPRFPTYIGLREGWDL